MRFAYADPPYLGCGKLYAKHHSEALVWDNPEAHRALIEGLCEDFSDGWVLSLSVPSLRVLLPMCPSDVRVGSWVKPFASFKPGVNPGYTWEPIIWRGGRKHERMDPTIRDHLAENITLKKGLTGAKPERFCGWVLDLLNAKSSDTLVDVFPGTGIMSRVAAARGITVEPL